MGMDWESFFDDRSEDVQDLYDDLVAEYDDSADDYGYNELEYANYEYSDEEIETTTNYQHQDELALVDNKIDDNIYFISPYKTKANEYSELGKIIHDLKYVYLTKDGQLRAGSEKEFYFKLNQLTVLFVDFYKEKHLNFDLLIPAPSYNPNTLENPKGKIKIVYELTKSASKYLGIPYNHGYLKKNTASEAKNTSLLREHYEGYSINEPIRDVVIIDDLYESGSTAKYSLSILKEKNPNINFQFLTLSRVLFGGIGKPARAQIHHKNGIRESKNGNEYITLIIFFEDGSTDAVNIFSNHDSLFLKVRNCYINSNDYQKLYNIKYKRNSNDKIWISEFIE